MRIALLSSQWPGIRLGGIGAYTRYCAAALAAGGHEPHVFTLPLPAPIRQAVPRGVIVHEIQDPAGADFFPGALPMGGRLKYDMALPFAAAVLAAHEQTPFDIVEAPEYEAPAFDLIAAQRIPVITQLHSGSALARHIHAAIADQEQVLREARELEVIAAADGLCAPSDAVIRDTQAAYGLPELGAHAEVIRLPFAAPDVPLTVPEDDAPVLFVGRLEWLKGAHLLARAAAAFLAGASRARLRIVGPDTLTAPDADGRPSGKSMAAWMRGQLAGVGDRVEFLGEQSSAEIQAEMRAAACVVIPSLCESYSYVCCEALAAGRPVIVSTDIGATEVAGPAGVSFARGDSGALAEALASLWADVARRASLGALAWHRARTELAPAAAIARRDAFYQRILAARARDGAADIEERMLSLPESHTFRLHVARALAAGEADLLPAFLPSADLPPPALTVGDRLLSRLAALGRPVRFHLYGAGRHTARLMQERPRWRAAGHTLVGLIDDHPRFEIAAENPAPTAHNLPVISCITAAAQLAATDVVVLSTDAFEEQFWHNTAPLREKGVLVLRLYA